MREIINDMMNVGAHTITCNNKTKIMVLDIGSTDYPSEITSKVKLNKDGTFKCFRKLLVMVTSSKDTQAMNLIEPYSMYAPVGEDGYCYFSEDDYLVPERELNLFISLNDGIDYYNTISVPFYMITDSVH